MKRMLTAALCVAAMTMARAEEPKTTEQKIDEIWKGMKEVRELRNEVNGLRNQVTGVQNEVTNVRSEMANMNERIARLEQRPTVSAPQTIVVHEQSQPVPTQQVAQVPQVVYLPYMPTQAPTPAPVPTYTYAPPTTYYEQPTFSYAPYTYENIVYGNSWEPIRRHPVLRAVGLTAAAATIPFWGPPVWALRRW